MSVVLEKLAKLQGGLPQPVYRKEIHVPDEVPGYRNWLNESGFDHWRRISKDLYDDGTSLLIWSPVSLTALLLLGAEAEAVRGRLKGWPS